MPSPFIGRILRLPGPYQAEKSGRPRRTGRLARRIQGGARPRLPAEAPRPAKALPGPPNAQAGGRPIDIFGPETDRKCQRWTDVPRRISEPPEVATN